MESEIINSLKQEIEETFGRKVLTARDCNDISEEIFLKLNERVHTNTLRRFFGLVNSRFHASASTLNILARYCGFDSLEGISQVQKSNCFDTPMSGEGEILRYFYALFKNTKTTKANDEVFLSQTKCVINFIDRNQLIADKLHKLIAKTKNGQEFYFEQFINIDKLNSYYGDGLRYYANEKHTDEAQIFAHSLLSFRYWLTGDVKKLRKHCEHVISHRLDESIHPFVSGRYFATQLYHAHASGVATEYILRNARKTHAELKQGRYNNKSVFCFELTFSEGLVLTEHYEEALFYLKESPDRHKNSNSYKEKGFYEMCDLLKTFAYSKLGEHDIALRILKRIRPAEFYFLSRKYKNILFFLSVIELNTRRSKIYEQLDVLIGSTGFSRLKDFIITSEHNGFAAEKNLKLHENEQK